MLKARPATFGNHLREERSYEPADAAIRPAVKLSVRGISYPIGTQSLAASAGFLRETRTVLTLDYITFLELSTPCKMKG